jgi:hypothetical protein
MKDGIEIGEMVLSGDNWMIRLHRSVTSMEYHWVWLVTQDRIAQLAYYQKQRNL